MHKLGAVHIRATARDLTIESAAVLRVVNMPHCMQCRAPHLNRPVSSSVMQSASTSCMATGCPGAVRSSASSSSGAGHPEPSGKPFRVTRRVCHSCAPRRLCACQG